MNIIQPNFQRRRKEVVYIDDKIKRPGYLVLTPCIETREQVNYIADDRNFGRELLEFLCENQNDYICVNLGQIDVISAGQMSGLIRLNNQHSKSRGDSISLITNMWMDKMFDAVGILEIFYTYPSAEQFSNAQYIP